MHYYRVYDDTTYLKESGGFFVDIAKVGPWVGHWPCSPSAYSVWNLGPTQGKKTRAFFDILAKATRWVRCVLVHGIRSTTMMHGVYGVHILFA